MLTRYSPASWIECDASTDRSGWTEPVRLFFEYWLTLRPTGRLPGRQHFDPLSIPKVMPRVWMLDVVWHEGGIRFRYRLVGTREVETLKRDVTGLWFDEVHPHVQHDRNALARYHGMVDTGLATYRKGRVIFAHDPDHKLVENCMAPLARDGQTVDMLAICSVPFRRNGSPAN